ncbi:MAG TPA: peptidoglycan DD-metalloendopeptidase family protein [Sandaracinaceae bacterium LLY-WYZ-13_1]|nr:peptidoglycan DD-metalloendopeptidase family protein [Sandaracinaceae bacterium LLY-WYZ-13_1]
MPEGPPEDGVQHRPLPSVGIPLLRDELRATRVRRLAALVGAVLLVIGAVLAAIFVPGWLPSGGDEAEQPAAAAAPAEPPPLSTIDDDDAGIPDGPLPNVETEEERLVVAEEELDEGTRVVRRFGESPGFRAALVNAGCEPTEADALISALEEVMDFRRCRPEHELVFERGEDGRLRRFEYRASTTQIYEATRDDEGTLVGGQVEVPIERVRIARGGTVRSSLGTALERAGLGRQLVGTFVEVFQRHVNFNTDTRAGDTFRILVDEERIGGEFLRYGRIHAVEVRGQRIGEHQAFWYEPREDLADFYDETGRGVHGGWLRTPLRYDHISSPYDPRRMHPILRRIVPHNGVDYAAGSGTPVWAAADGTVTFIGPRGANGNLISLRHENGYETHYAHLLRFASGLERGDRVEQRQVIGYVGSTGRSTGPHLHFGLKHHGRYVDPQEELNGPGRMMPAAFRGRYRRHVRRLQAELAEIPVTGGEADAEADADDDAIDDQATGDEPSDATD